MGMFDDVKFVFRMPDGYHPRWGNYQTKDLECKGDTYVIEAGRLVKTSHIDDDPTAGDVNFSGMLNIYSPEGIRGTLRSIWHEYNLEFVDGALKVIHCDQTEMALLFDPCDMQAGTEPDEPTSQALLAHDSPLAHNNLDNDK